MFVNELNNEVMSSLVKECIIISGINNKEILNFILNNNHNF